MFEYGATDWGIGLVFFRLEEGNEIPLIYMPGTETSSKWPTYVFEALASLESNA